MTLDGNTRIQEKDIYIKDWKHQNLFFQVKNKFHLVLETGTLRVWPFSASQDIDTQFADR